MLIAVIPGRNVERFVYDVIKRTLGYADKVIFVDDGSDDKSSEEAKRAGAEIIKFEKNLGKGTALRAGFTKAMKMNADLIAMLDSDGQHKPEELPLLLEEIENGADMVIGSRYAGRFYTIPRNVLGNYGLNFATNLLSYGPLNLLRHKWLGDTQSGFRIIRESALKKMKLEARKYEIEGELCYEAAINRFNVKEVPITISHWVRGVRMRDGLKNGLFIFKKRFGL